MKRKILALAAAAVMTVSFSGCAEIIYEVLDSMDEREDTGYERSYFDDEDDEETEAVPGRQTAETKRDEKPSAGSSGKNRSGIRPEFKKAMDSYEEFMDEYVDFMQRYSSSSDTLSMLSEYMEYLEKYSEAMDDLDSIDDEELSDEELEYYTEVLLRVEEKLLKLYT